MGCVLGLRKNIPAYLTIISVDTLESSVIVAGGLFTSIVPARSAIAIHTGALGIGSGSGGGGGGGGAVSVAVTFQETATTTFGEVSREPLFKLQLR